MLKFIVLLLTFIYVSFAAVEIEFTIPLEKKLKDSFYDYWSSRAIKKHDKNYDKELPYQQFLHTQEWYEDFLQESPRIEKIIVRKIMQNDDNMQLLGIELKMQNRSDLVWYDDKWYFIEGKWYHKYNDSLLPKFK